jgi:hypothetical protein
MKLVIKPETEATLQTVFRSGGFADVDALIAKAMEVMFDSVPDKLHRQDEATKAGTDSPAHYPR